MKEYVKKYAKEDLRISVSEQSIVNEQSNESELSNASEFHESENE